MEGFKGSRNKHIKLGSSSYKDIDSLSETFDTCLFLYTLLECLHAGF